MQLGMLTDPRSEPLEQIEWAARNDFDYVDLHIAAPAAALESTDRRAVGQAIADAGLDIVCYAAGDYVINNPSPAIRQVALNELRRCADAARIVGVSVPTTRSLGWPPYLDEATGYEYYRQLYGVLLAHGRERVLRSHWRTALRTSTSSSGFARLLPATRSEAALQRRQRQRRNPPEHDARLPLCPGRSPGPGPRQRQRRQPPRSPALDGSGNRRT